MGFRMVAGFVGDLLITELGAKETALNPKPKTLNLNSKPQPR